MCETLALRLLGRIMDWNEETASEEFGWLRVMSRLKHDDYRDYLAGVRFVESLAGGCSNSKLAIERRRTILFGTDLSTFQTLRFNVWSINFTRERLNLGCSKR
jgi:hypothetical protein